MTEATTTGRRTWRLFRTLALPWFVCGGLLWASVSATPSATPRTAEGFEVGTGPTGLTADVGLVAGTPANPHVLTAVWNVRGLNTATFEDMTADDPLVFELLPGPAWFSIFASGSSAGPWAALHISFWLLLPFPLLWSGFNLWRWVQRANR